MTSLWATLYRYFSSYMSKTGHKRKMRLLALQLCQEIPISTDEYTLRPKTCHFLDMRRIRQNYVIITNIAFSACVMNIFIGTRDKSTDCDRSTIFTLSNKVSTHKSHYSVSYCPWCKLIWPHFYARGLHFGPRCIVLFRHNWENTVTNER